MLKTYKYQVKSLFNPNPDAAVLIYELLGVCCFLKRAVEIQDGRIAGDHQLFYLLFIPLAWDRQSKLAIYNSYARPLFNISDGIIIIVVYINLFNYINWLGTVWLFHWSYAITITCWGSQEQLVWTPSPQEMYSVIHDVHNSYMTCTFMPQVVAVLKNMNPSIHTPKLRRRCSGGRNPVARNWTPNMTSSLLKHLYM